MADKDPEKILKETLETVEVLKDSFNSLGAIIKDKIANNLFEVDNVSKSIGKNISNDISRSFKSLGKDSEELLKNQELLNKGQAKSKDIQKQINELSNKRNSLEVDINNAAKNNLINTTQQKNLIKELNQKIEETNDKLKEQLNIAQQTEKAMGSLGKLVSGLKEIPFLGKLIDTEKVLTAMQQKAAETGSRFQTMLAGIKAIGSSIKESLLDPLTLITFFLKSALTANKESVNLSKSLGYGAENADRVRENFAAIERSSSNLNVTTANLLGAFNELSTATGFVTEYSADALETQIKLTKQLGLTGDEAAGVYKFSVLTGKSSEQTYQSLLNGYRSTRNALNVGVPFKAAIAEAAKVSGQLASNLKNNPENIIKGVVATKALGTSLEQAKNQGEKLLDFQSSIENELKAELITGQQLNLERARAAALMGDQVAVAEELAAQGMTAAKFSQMNVVAQNSYAQALGTTSDELANQLTKREMAIASGKSLAQLASDEADEAARRQDIQTKFNAAMEKLQSLIGNLIAGPLGTMLDLLSGVLNVVNLIGNAFSFLAKPLQILAGLWLTIKGIQLTSLALSKGAAIIESLRLGYSVAAAAAKTEELGVQATLNLMKGEELATQIGIAAAWAIANPLTALAGIAVAGAVAGGLYALSKKADDYSSDGYGKRTLFTPEGTIRFNDKDTILAGTDPSLKGGIRSPQATMDLSPVIAAMDNMTKSVDRLHDKETVIKMGTKEVGTALMMGSYRSA